MLGWSTREDVLKLYGQPDDSFEAYSLTYETPDPAAAPVGSCTLTTPVFCTMLRCVIRRIPARINGSARGAPGISIHISTPPIHLVLYWLRYIHTEEGAFVMGEQAGQSRRVKRICAGILAHVDSGKTTLAEAMLYRAGALRRLGRVDHRDAFLDTDAQERARGITIFAKQAVLALPAAPGPGGEETVFTLLDTPGHVDFSAEAERTLQVLDYAILVVSGTDGVQAHTQTLWRLLEALPRADVCVHQQDGPARGGPRRAPARAARPLWRRLCGLWPRCARRRPRRGAGHGQRTADGAGAFGRGPAGGRYRHGIARREVFPCLFGAGAAAGRRRRPACRAAPLHAPARRGAGVRRAGV